MSDEEAFLAAIKAEPTDRTLRLVYADWLEERGDSRAEYLRLEARAAGLTPSHDDSPAVRRRMVELRAHLPPAWLSLLGSYRSSGSSDPDPWRAEEVAGALGRQVRYIDEQGYERDMVAAATSGATGTMAYVESRSRWSGNVQDISYHLRLRDSAGREAAWEVESYNPYFGCNVGFLDCYGDVVLLIYREKHDTYVCRFGLDSPAEFRAIEDDWVLDGPELGYWGYKETTVRRLAVPALVALPPLSEWEAARWELLPAKFW
jgi:uncharacterized protein (TIGR02996 family)